MKSNGKANPVKVHLGLTGGIRIVDEEAFFAQPEVQRKIALIRNADIVGKKLNDLTIIKKPSKE